MWTNTCKYKSTCKYSDAVTHTWRILLLNITSEIQTLISNVFWQLTYEQHTVKGCQRELWRREISARPNLPPALVLTCWRLTSFSFLIPSVWIWEEYDRSAACKKNKKCNLCVCMCVSVKTNSAVPLYRWWSCTSTPVCFAVSSWGGFASWVSPSCTAPSSSSCTGKIKQTLKALESNESPYEWDMTFAVCFLMNDSHP